MALKIHKRQINSIIGFRYECDMICVNFRTLNNNISSGYYPMSFFDQEAQEYIRSTEEYKEFIK